MCPISISSNNVPNYFWVIFAQLWAKLGAPWPTPLNLQYCRVTVLWSTVLFVTVLNSRINSWETWFIFNLRKININQHCNSVMIIQRTYYKNSRHFPSYEKTYSYNFVHTWTAFFLEHLPNASFMASIPAWTEPPVSSVSQAYSLFALAHPASCCLLQQIKFLT